MKSNQSNEQSEGASGAVGCSEAAGAGQKPHDLNTVRGLMDYCYGSETAESAGEQPTGGAGDVAGGEGPAHSEADGAVMIATERERQIGAEGWFAEHDDDHTQGELIAAAIAYAVAAHDQVIGETLPDGPPGTWPWEAGWWKRSDDPIRNLVKAGALLAAEIDRLKRDLRRRPPLNGAAELREGTL